MKWQTKALPSSSKLPIVKGGILLNHTLAAPFKAVGKALYIISSGVFYKFIRLLKDSIWSSESFEPSNQSRFLWPFPFIALFNSSICFFMFWNSSSILIGHSIPLEWSFLRLFSYLLLCCSLFFILGEALLLFCLSSSFCLVSSSTLAIRVQICSSIWFEESRSIERTKFFCSRLEHWF